MEFFSKILDIFFKVQHSIGHILEMPGRLRWNKKEMHQLETGSWLLTSLLTLEFVDIEYRDKETPSNRKINW